MLRIRNVLAPIDFSEISDCALKLAASLADDYGARLTVLHVAAPPAVAFVGEVPMPIPVPDTSEYLNEQCRRLAELEIEPADLMVDRSLVDGDPATEILVTAERIKADLIVLGTHGRKGLSRLLMGSVAERVVRKAAVPVLLAKAPRPDTRSTRTESEAYKVETATISV